MKANHPFTDEELALLHKDEGGLFKKVFLDSGKPRKELTDLTELEASTMLKMLGMMLHELTEANSVACRVLFRFIPACGPKATMQDAYINKNMKQLSSELSSLDSAISNDQSLMKLLLARLRAISEESGKLMIFAVIDPENKDLLADLQLLVDKYKLNMDETTPEEHEPSVEEAVEAASKFVQELARLRKKLDEEQDDKKDDGQ